MGGDLVGGAVEFLDHGLGHDLHALLLEALLGEGGDLLVLHGQDAVHDLDHGRVGAERVVEAGEFDADGARADDQQFLRHMRRVSACLVGPDPLAVGLQPRKLAGARAGGEDDVAGRQLLGALVGLDGDLALGGQRRLAHDHRDLVLLHQVADAGIQLLGHPAGAFHDRVEIVGDVVGLSPKSLARCIRWNTSTSAASPWSGCSPS
jgi:hypothetical protein